MNIKCILNDIRYANHFDQPLFLVANIHETHKISLFFDFCFEGIEKGSTVAVSTYMATEHDNRKNQKNWFMAGYNEMLRRIEPERIICYNTPFPEMEGNIIHVDYERSSWRYMNYERNLPREDLEGYKIGGAISTNYDIMVPYMVGKGGGSVYGGAWQPSKPEDYRLIGKPGEIKISYAKDGTKIETKIGEDGRAVAERHYTDHKQPWAHSNPHDHKISWEYPRYGIPNFIKPHINYWPENYPSGAPDFKQLRRVNMVCMSNAYKDSRFQTVSEFTECLIRGGEIAFSWNNINYSVTSYAGKYAISQFYLQETEQRYETPDEVLEYMVGTDRLRDVIKQVTVLDRTI